MDDVAGKLVARGALVGALAGLLAFGFTRIWTEPVIQAAIDYEQGRESAQEALNHAAATAAEHGEHDLISRATQAGLGLGVGTVVFGIAMGALVAVVFTVCLGRVGGVRPRGLAVLVAGSGFLTSYLVPFLKYPANPPAIGRPETIGPRTGLYLLMVVCALVALGGAVWLGARLRARLGAWNAALLAGAAFIVVVGVVMALLPSTGELAANVAQLGHQTTETPQPLRNAAGTIVYPGFPADELYAFRLYSLTAQLILWAGIGLGFGPLAERLLLGRYSAARAATTRNTARSNA